MEYFYEVFQDGLVDKYLLFIVWIIMYQVLRESVLVREYVIKKNRCSDSFFVIKDQILVFLISSISLFESVFILLMFISLFNRICANYSIKINYLDNIVYLIIVYKFYFMEFLLC